MKRDFGNKPLIIGAPAQRTQLEQNGPLRPGPLFLLLACSPAAPDGLTAAPDRARGCAPPRPIRRLTPGPLVVCVWVCVCLYMCVFVSASVYFAAQ